MPFTWNLKCHHDYHERFRYFLKFHENNLLIKKGLWSYVTLIVIRSSNGTQNYNFKMVFWQDVPRLKIHLFTKRFLKIINSLWCRHHQSRLPSPYNYKYGNLFLFFFWCNTIYHIEVLKNGQYLFHLLVIKNKNIQKINFLEIKQTFGMCLLEFFKFR